jgi:Protein of unknown function (DUF3568)
LDIALRKGGIMVKKKFTPVVLLCCLLIGLNACTRYVVAGAAAAGVGAGTYFFVKGNLKMNYEVPVEGVWEATLQAVKELGLTVESKKHDAFGGIIKGKLADGTNFEIKLERLGEKSTEVGVRIGVFGHRSKSEAIHDKILSKL